MRSFNWLARTTRYAMPMIAALGISAVANAQDMRAPVGPIEITIPGGAGSTPDVLMRRVAQILNKEKIVENPIVVVDRPGGAGAVGTNWLLNRPKDENTVLGLCEPVFSHAIAQGLPIAYNKFTPLAVFVQTTLVVLAQPDHKANNLADLVALAKQKPGTIKVSGANAASTDAQVMGLIEKAANVDLVYIPHDGGGAAQATFLGGNTDLITVTIDEALPLVQAGKAKYLAMLTNDRRTEAAVKDIPTAKEQGIDVVWGQIFGLVGAPGLDPAVARWWEDKITKLVATEAWKKSLSDNFLGGEYTHGDKIGAYLDSVQKNRVDVLRQIGASKI
jgi:putative tricarboxylic transport membrane protein